MSRSVLTAVGQNSSWPPTACSSCRRSRRRSFAHRSRRRPAGQRQTRRCRQPPPAATFALRYAISVPAHGGGYAVENGGAHSCSQSMTTSDTWRRRGCVVRHQAYRRSSPGQATCPSVADIRALAAQARRADVESRTSNWLRQRGLCRATSTPSPLVICFLELAAMRIGTTTAQFQRPGS